MRWSRWTMKTEYPGKTRDSWVTRQGLPRLRYITYRICKRSRKSNQTELEEVVLHWEEGLLTRTNTRLVSHIVSKTNCSTTITTIMIGDTMYVHDSFEGAPIELNTAMKILYAKPMMHHFEWDPQKITEKTQFYLTDSSKTKGLQEIIDQVGSTGL